MHFEGGIWIIGVKASFQGNFLQACFAHGVGKHVTLLVQTFCVIYLCILKSAACLYIIMGGNYVVSHQTLHTGYGRVALFWGVRKC